MSDKIIPLIELLETYQGEGPNAGKRMVLARFKYCNKLCPFCDTQKIMNNLETTNYSVDDIAKLLVHSKNLMITGGEPTIKNVINSDISQYDCTYKIISELNYDFCDIETNGLNITSLYCDIIYNLPDKNINISWSPKFISKDDYAINEDKLSFITKNRYWPKLITLKLVIGEGMDEYIEFAKMAVGKYGFNSNNIYLMPKGVNIKEINESFPIVLNLAKELECNISSRLHIIHNFI